MIELNSMIISQESTLRDAMQCINQNEKGIVLVVNDAGNLLDTLTDGDLRRAMLNGSEMDSPVSLLAGRRVGTPYPNPVTALAGSSPESLIELMLDEKLRHVPLVDEQGKFVDLALLSDLLNMETGDELPLTAMIMAGGRGLRLNPLTETVPKPMLPVGEKPLMERIIEGLKSSGIRRLSVSTHHMSEVITDHFGDGRRFGVEINYINEDRPLGTAGSLALMEPPTDPLLVMNGDILTNLDFRALLAFHKENEAAMTVGVSDYRVQVPYGVIELDGVEILKITEKPNLHLFINAGVYLIEPEVCKLVPRGQRFDMTDLIQKLLDDGQRVTSFPIGEYWLDVGQHADYAKAQHDVNNMGGSAA